MSETRRDISSSPSTVCFLLAAILLLSIWTVGSEANDITPSDHGLANEKSTGTASPAMKAFFGSSSSAALPEAAGRGNATDPIWDLTGRETPVEGWFGGGESAGRKRGRTALLTVGIVCAVVGVGMLAGAALVYVVQRKRAAASEDDEGPGRVLHQLEPV